MKKLISSKKISWVNWNKVIAPKDKGGLGVSSLYALNRGLLFKWIWRFLTQGSSLWARVVKAIHGEDGNIGSKCKGGSKSSWSSIVSEVKTLENKGIDLMQFLKIKIGNGDSIRLWEDFWHEDGILKVSRAPIADRWAWMRNSSGEFTVASARQYIDDKLCADSEVVSYNSWKEWVNNLRLPVKFKLMFEGVYNVMWWLLWRYRSKVSFSWNDWCKNPNLIIL
ncbi:hypothetical protein Tco_0960902 [Tanacetum coccineum]